MSREERSDALPPGSRILWYEIVRVLGKGGFGITYLGKDTNLDQMVAIKEYLPVGFAMRSSQGAVKPSSEQDAATFAWGLDRFLQEAQILARFKHPNIVRVLSFFRDGNTAYMVMEYEEGESLDAILKRRNTLPEDELKRLLIPLLSGLETMHAADFIHRDLKPPNLFVRKDGSPVLLDFGAARQAVAGQAQQHTSLLSVGYSPFEQYDSSGHNQGPWSDIYAMGGVIYKCITGEKPIDAAMRIHAKLRNIADPLMPASVIAARSYSPGFLRAIDLSLQVIETDRPQSVAAWRNLLLGASEEAPTTLGSPPMRPAAPLSSAPQREETPPEHVIASRSQAPKKSSWRSFISSLNEFGSQTQLVKKSGLPDNAPASGMSNSVAPSPPASAPAPTFPPLVSEPEPAPPPASEAPGVLESPRNEGGRILKLGDVWVESMTRMEFTWIPGGKFMMGSPKGEPGRRPDEGPVHEVEVDGFWMAKYPVTWHQWKRVMGDAKGLYSHQRAQYPVERVLWEGTQSFIRQFLRMVGGGENKIRLPTEAEWEFAARAGSPSTYFWGDDPAGLRQYAWTMENSDGGTHPVGEKPANPWGLHDILGNVWEWTEDWYSEDYYGKSPAKNPRGAPFGDVRVRRGGSWRSQADACRVAHRNRVSVQSNSNALGFRLVRTPD
ncbi:MAG: SUMF1/EgtB/PvdO family nonheme iron enzyme [Magnetococcales bacterium]|nr:SUMF1/EgtB/PvdO family nonheme iron enzyme [Magnetococcales bacterium]